MIGARPIAAASSAAPVRREPRAAALQIRAITTVPALFGGLAALSAVIAQLCSHREDPLTMYALALVLSTAGVGFVLDDPAAEILAASPLPLSRRRAIRIVVTAAIVLTTWTAIALAVAIASVWEEFPLRDIALELIALSSISLAVSAVVQRSGGGSGGPPAALVVLLAPAIMSALAFRNIRVFPSLVPGSPLHHRWSWLALIAIVVLTRANRDPARPAHMFRRAQSRSLTS